MKKSKLVLSKLLFGDYTELGAFSSKIALIFLFFNFFLFFLINLLTNFIKTDAVIVNTDEIIDSNEKLLSTPKILFTQQFHIDHYSSFPKSSLLFKLIKRKKEQNQLLTGTRSNARKFLKKIMKGESSFFFILSSKSYVLYSLFLFSVFAKNKIIFIKPTSYHEIIFVYNMRKKLEKNKKKFINQWYVIKNQNYNFKTLLIFNRNDRFFENGIYQKLLKDMEKLTLYRKKPLNKKIVKNQKVNKFEVAKFFDNVDDYINEYISASDFNLTNYQRLFLFFFLFCILILFVFVIHCLIVYLYPVFLLFRFIIVRMLYLRK